MIQFRISSWVGRCEDQLNLFCGTVSRRELGLNLIKLAYDATSAAWPAKLTASAFNQQRLFASSLDLGPTFTQNSPFLP